MQGKQPLFCLSIQRDKWMLEEQKWKSFSSPSLFTDKNRKEGGDSVPGEETVDGPKGTENLLGVCKRHGGIGGKK